MAAGDWTLLLRVRGYNGLPDDDRVRLDWYIPAEFYVLQDGGKAPPAWDGSDAWPIRTTSLHPPASGQPWDADDTKCFDEHAYVTNGVLVASIAEATIKVTEDYGLTIVGAFMTARVVQREGSWVLEEGTVAGRWPIDSIFSQVSTINDPIFGMPICTDSPVYPEIKQKVCSFVDIYSGVGSPTTPCDAVSAGMLFETEPAQLGPVVDIGEADVKCAPEVDPANDSCNTL